MILRANNITIDPYTHRLILLVAGRKVYDIYRRISGTNRGPLPKNTTLSKNIAVRPQSRQNTGFSCAGLTRPRKEVQ